MKDKDKKALAEGVSTFDKVVLTAMVGLLFFLLLLLLGETKIINERLDFIEATIEALEEE